MCRVTISTGVRPLVITEDVSDVTSAGATYRDRITRVTEKGTYRPTATPRMEHPCLTSMSDSHDCTKHLLFDHGESGGWSVVVKCEECGQRWYPQWMVKEKLRELANRTIDYLEIAACGRDTYCPEEHREEILLHLFPNEP